MPLPKPKTDETKDDFITRCMGDSVMLAEFPGTDQRYAVCNSNWDKKMTDNFQQVKTLASLKRYEKYEGEDYLVLPTVLLTEGVHNGLYYPPEQLAKYPSCWDGRPIPVYHPEDPQGVPISSNSPKTLPRRMGHVFNTVYDDGKVKAELWLSKKKLREWDSKVLRDLEAGVPMDISTGLWSDEVGGPGKWNDEEYIATVADIKPDHVALLPGVTGACSWKDGCGVPRLNHEQGGSMTKERQIFWEQFQNLFQTNRKKLPISHDELRQALSGLVTTTGQQYVYVTDVFDDYFAYEIGRAATGGLEDMQLYKQAYKIEDDKPVLDGAPKKVQLQRKYVPLTNDQEPSPAEPKAPAGALESNKPTTNQDSDCAGAGDKKTLWGRLKGWFKENEVDCEEQQRFLLALESLEDNPTINKQTTNADGGKTMSKEELVKGLIEDEGTQYDEDDREWLSSLGEAQLKKMGAKVKANKEPAPKEPEPKKDEPKPVALTDVLASKEFAEAVAVTVKTLMDQEKKTDLIAKAKKLKGLALTDAEIQAMPESALVKLIKANAAADFSGRGADVSGNRDDKDSVPEPPSILSAKIDKEVKQ